MTGLKQGDAVLDVGTGYGYWAEAARVITKSRVDCHNASEWEGFFRSIGFDNDSGVKRLKAQGEEAFNFFWASFNEPADGKAGVYDLVVSYGNYHDLYDMPVDRASFLQSIKASLKPGTGRFLLVDHRASPGSGVRDAGSNRGLHRIDEATVRAELQDAGFEMLFESDILALPTDNPRSQAWTNPMHETDRFCFLLGASSPSAP